MSGLAEDGRNVILTLTIEVDDDGHVSFRQQCPATTPFKDVLAAMRAAAKQIGSEIKNRHRCPFAADPYVTAPSKHR